MATQGVWPVNKNGEIVVSSGTGDSVVTGFLSQDILPSSDNKIPFANITSIESDSSGKKAFYNIAGELSNLPSNSFIKRIKQPTNDINIFVSSDSTGNASDEWVYLLSQWLATKTTSSVTYRIWNVSSDAYDAAETISTGTSGYSVNIYNAAISGSRPDYILGSRFAAAVRDIPTCDLIILNHGHNMITQYSDVDPKYRRIPQYLEAIYSYLQVHAGAGLVMLTQNPRRDDDTYLPVYSTILQTAHLVGATVADSYKLFVAANKDASLYLDNIHPSPTGTQFFLKAVQAAISSDSDAVINQMNILRKNLVLNGDFAAFSSAVPDSWVAEGATTSKNTTNFEYGTYSVTVTPTGASLGRIYQNAPAAVLNNVKGCWVTLAVRVFSANGTAGTAGRIGLHTTSTSTNTSAQTVEGKGGFVWKMISIFVKPTDTYLRVSLYGDTSTTQAVASFDRVILCKGRLPTDI